MTSPRSTLRVALDVQALQARRAPERGIPRYVGSHAKALLRYGQLIHSLCLNAARPFPKDLDLALLNSGKLDWGGASVLRSAIEQGQLIYWIMSPFESECGFDSVLPRTFAAEHGRLVVTLYDLIPLLFPGPHLDTPARRARYQSALEIVRMADLVLTISECTRKDAIRALGVREDRIAVIGAGVPDFFNPVEGLEFDAAILKEWLPRVRPPFLFTLLGDDPRKNAEGLIEAYGRLPQEVSRRHMLVVGGRYSDAAIDGLLRAAGGQARDRIVFTKTVNDACLRALYRACALFVFPARYEGFGLPVAEALACGCVAIASNRSALPELVEDKAALFNPEDPADIAACIARALDDDALRRRCRAQAQQNRQSRGWDQIAAKSINELLRFEKPKPPRVRNLRPKIALVGPFPPQKSGIADYNLHAARALSKITDLFVFHSGSCNTKAIRDLQVMDCRPAADLGTGFSAAYLDGVVYSFGNSSHHLETFDKIFDFPGILWLHDVHVLDFYRFHYRTIGTLGDPGLEQIARRMYGHRSPPPVDGIEPFGPDSMRRWGAHFTRDLLRASRGVIVSSRHALEMLRFDQQPGSRLPPAWVIPLSAKTLTRHAQPPSPSTGAGPVIATFGFVGKDKGSEVLIDAISMLPASLNAKLVFVGGADAVSTEQVFTRATERRIADSVFITGFVSDDQWLEHLWGAACAVQLRLHGHGESSGAVADCIAAGLPVITNIASCEEIEEDAVMYVPPDVSAGALRDALLTLSAGGPAWARIHEGALRYAAANSFEAAAAQIAGAVMQVARSPKCEVVSVFS